MLLFSVPKEKCLPLRAAALTTSGLCLLDEIIAPLFFNTTEKQRTHAHPRAYFTLQERMLYAAKTHASIRDPQ